MSAFPESLAVIMNSHGDGAHWGITNHYDEIRQGILAAIGSGKDFDTGWYSSKKEIWSGRIIRLNDTFVCQGSCSDDFDTEGFGEEVIEVRHGEPPEAALERICEALDRAMEGAEENRKDNQVYAGWSIGQAHPETGARINWLYTYIQPVGDGGFMDRPPGDNYHWWGWDDIDPDEEQDCSAEARRPNHPELPEHIRDAFEEFIQSYEGETITIEGWRCDSWMELDD
jgi:hypothetical protein